MQGLKIPVIHGAALDRPDEADTILTAQAVFAALTRLGARSSIHRVDGRLSFPGQVTDGAPDLVFNLVEALDGDSAAAIRVPAALDRLGIAYSGCGAAACEACVSKLDMKRAMRAADLPTPSWSRDGGGFAAKDRIIVKSDTEHASLGIDAASVVSGAEASAEIAVREGRFGGRFFAETYIAGREFNLSILNGEILPPAEIIFNDYPADRPQIVDYEAKWEPGAFAYENTPRRFEFPPEDEALVEEMTRLALAAWALFGLSGYARVDFRVDAGGAPTILEVNTNPCLAPDAGFAAACAVAGIGYDALVAQIAAAARARRSETA